MNLEQMLTEAKVADYPSYNQQFLVDLRDKVRRNIACAVGMLGVTAGAIAAGVDVAEASPAAESAADATACFSLGTVSILGISVFAAQTMIEDDNYRIAKVWLSMNSVRNSDEMF